jgi:hypothetical protein
MSIKFVKTVINYETAPTSLDKFKYIIFGVPTHPDGSGIVTSISFVI